MSETPIYYLFCDRNAAERGNASKQPVHIRCAQCEMESLETRNRELERALEKAPHDSSCKFRSMPRGSFAEFQLAQESCNCWKSRIERKEGH